MIKKLFVCLLAILLVTGCTPSDTPSENKTEYYLDEIATIDDYEITLIEQEYKNDRLVLTFEITNYFDDAKVIDNDNFSLMIGTEQIGPNNNLEETISGGKTKQVVINFAVDELDEYMLIFYSKVVTNNIGFKIEL